MIYSSFTANVLSRPNQHILCRRDINHRRLARVVMRDPKRYRKPVYCATKLDGQSATESEQKGGDAIFVGCDDGKSDID